MKHYKTRTKYFKMRSVLKFQWLLVSEVETLRIYWDYPLRGRMPFRKILRRLGDSRWTCIDMSLAF